MAARKTFFVETFGCQMNVNDSEKVAGLLRAEGYEPAREASEAGVVFINTCAVREGAAEKLYHTLGRLRKLKAADPDLVIAVGGCVAQLQGERIWERAPYVDVLVGTHNFGRIGELVRQAQSRFRACLLDRNGEALELPIQMAAHSNPVRAYVTAMEGCNHVCSFCVVPRTRGVERCRPPDAIVQEVRSLVERGFREVTLLGQTVNAYASGVTTFPELLSLVSGIDGLARLRFTTSHPAHVGEPLGRAFADLENLCPYLHLPFQSGSDRVLRAMRRGYTNAEYRERIQMLREYRPQLALSSDVIVGYPGETEEDFEATLDLVERMGFDGLFVFAYSPRPGTTAFREGDDVPDEVKQRRLAVLNARQQARQARRNALRVGSLEEVLIEGFGAKGGLMGRSADFRIVHLDGPAAFMGQIVPVRIIRSGPNSLQGHLQQPIH